jgi:hypothetical protein
MAIYTTDKEISYTCVTGEEGSEMVSVFIDGAANEAGDTTFKIKEEDGGITFITSKAMAKEIASTFSFASEDEEEAAALVKALNQIISLVAGRDLAVATNEFADRPAYRVGEMLLKIPEELIKASQSGDMKTLKQAQRKMESLTNLKKIADAIG